MAGSPRSTTYFAENDPYRHPTTASKSGDVDWPEGFAVMDVAQVHVYALDEGPVNSAETIAPGLRRCGTVQKNPTGSGNSV